MKVYYEVQCWDMDREMWRDYSNDSKFATEAEAEAWIAKFDQVTEANRNYTQYFRIQRVFGLSKSQRSVAVPP